MEIKDARRVLRSGDGHWKQQYERNHFVRGQQGQARYMNTQERVLIPGGGERDGMVTMKEAQSPECVTGVEVQSSRSFLPVLWQTRSAPSPLNPSFLGKDVTKKIEMEKRQHFWRSAECMFIYPFLSRRPNRWHQAFKKMHRYDITDNSRHHQNLETQHSQCFRASMSHHEGTVPFDKDGVVCLAVPWSAV